ncbi:predicted protein [Pyrenophora tritici-repentis Pt-1C-BFP]|uniref:Uncharacterized protein n=1 Tax=Pyrenophora tritici-repentis (strain Pt-1C-BFP) TaxID=426418 RepID=B2VUK3_PYRTR|nr:uncharacterized protein PTRG_01059 [Pyrenophora tritici-repentis Pt-1C-BFP]EDU40497.1 predicted protein [Pyrenophora tritici-repentis Pt-1C-BFP]
MQAGCDGVHTASERTLLATAARAGPSRVPSKWAPKAGRSVADPSFRFGPW